MLSKRSQTQKTTYHVTISMKCPEKADLWRQNIDQWLPGAGSESRTLHQTDNEETC